MDNRGRLPLGGGCEPRRLTSAIKLERDCEVMQARREPGDPVTSTHVRKEDLSEVPRKVPRFQYVDFPSLHQCIKQLSVPPLEGWLASCPLGRVPPCQPSSPKEKVPKFKYVDYPSLYHCIQQLSVPPLEIWSSGLTKPGLAELRGATTGQSPSQTPGNITREDHQELRRKTPSQQSKDSKSPNPRPPVQELSTLHHPKYASSSETVRKPCTDPDDTSLNPSGSRRSESDSRSELARVTIKKERDVRPSVISMVRSERHRRSPEPEEWSTWRKALHPVAQVEHKTVPKSICPFCQQVFTDPEEFQTHQRSHKDKRPH